MRPFPPEEPAVVISQPPTESSVKPEQSPCCHKDGSTRPSPMRANHQVAANPAMGRREAGLRLMRLMGAGWQIVRQQRTCAVLGKAPARRCCGPASLNE